MICSTNQVPQQIPSAHAQTELLSNHRDLLCSALKKLKVSRSVTSCKISCCSRQFFFFQILYPFSVFFQIAYLIFLLFFKLIMIDLFHLSFPINFFGLIKDLIYCSHSGRSWSSYAPLQSLSSASLAVPSVHALNSAYPLSFTLPLPHTNEQLREWKWTPLFSWCPFDQFPLPQDLRHNFFHSEPLSGQHPNLESGSSRQDV